MKRSLERIDKSDLQHLLELARSDIENFFARNPRYEEYKGKEKIIVLAQGAALHYIDVKTGIKDFVYFPHYGSFL